MKVIASCWCAVLMSATLVVSVQGAQPDATALTSARQHKAMFEDAEAIDDYTKYLKANPNDEVARRERMEEYRNEHRFPECIADLKILLKSKNVWMTKDSATNLGKLYQARGEYKEAIAMFQLARKQGERMLLSEIVDCAIKAGDLKLALDSANLMMSNEPIVGHDSRAKTYMAMHHPKEALEDYTFVVNQYKIKYAKTNKESQGALALQKKLATELMERAKCYDALKQPNLAKQDRETVRVAEKDIYDDSPFLVKDKH